jgi:hypothetical protein
LPLGPSRFIPQRSGDREDSLLHPRRESLDGHDDLNGRIVERWHKHHVT